MAVRFGGYLSIKSQIRWIQSEAPLQRSVIQNTCLMILTTSVPGILALLVVLGEGGEVSASVWQALVGSSLFLGSLFGLFQGWQHLRNRKVLEGLAQNSGFEPQGLSTRRSSGDPTDRALVRIADRLEQARILELIVENLPMMIYVKESQELRFVNFNSAGERILGVERRQILGKNDFDFFPKDQAEAYMAKDRQVIEQGNVLVTEEETVPTGLGPRLFKSTRIPIFDHRGFPTHLIGISEDISDVQEARAKAQYASKMAALGEMSGGIAHEINNPLAVISGRVYQIREILGRSDYDNQSVFNGLKSIDDMTGRIDNIIRALLSYARDAAADEPSEVTLQSIFDDLHQLAGSKFERDVVRLEMPDIPHDLSLVCRAPQISQVILNLLNNARVAASEHDPAWVRVQVAFDDDWLVLRVSDCGPGIPEELREKIMQPFFTTKGVGQGTGLGLSISKGLLETHGGDLTIDSDAPNTTFVVRLPRHQQTNSTQETKKSA